MPARAPRIAATPWRPVWSHRYLYLMLLPGLLYYVIFHYVPMYGALIAFKDFSATRGILGSRWAGLKHFAYLFSLDKFGQVFANTIVISLYRLAFGFPTPIIAALLLNEIRGRAYKRTIQTVIYLPHFVSWVIMGGIIVNLLAIDYGLVNVAIKTLGGQPIPFLTDTGTFRTTLVFSMIWKEYGWTTILYLAAIAGVDPQLYEAALMDGAGRWRQLLHVTLPCIAPTVIVVLILRIGGLMEAGFEQVFVMYHPGVFRVADIIDTYVYRIGLTEGRFSLAAAVGLFKSAISLTLLVAANSLSRRYSESGTGVY